jgi:hypothetical protein
MNKVRYGPDLSEDLERYFLLRLLLCHLPESFWMLTVGNILH